MSQPPPIYLDDAHPNQDLSDQIRFYASLLAVTDLGVGAHLAGNPPLYTPTNPSTTTMMEYLGLFHSYQQRLLTAMQSSSEPSQ